MKASVVSYMWLSASKTGKSIMGFGMATSVMTGPLCRRFRARGTVGFQLRRQYYRTTSLGTIGPLPRCVTAGLVRRCPPRRRATNGGGIRSMQSFASMLAPGPPASTRPRVRRIARSLYERTKSLPIVSPHGHCDPAALADDAAFEDPGDRAGDQGPLHPPHALQPGRCLLEALGCTHSTARRRSPTEGGRGVKLATRLRPLPGHTVQTLARSHTPGDLRRRRTARAPRTPTLCTTRSRRVWRRTNFRPRALFDGFRVEFLATTDGCPRSAGGTRGSFDDRVGPGRVRADLPPR